LERVKILGESEPKQKEWQEKKRQRKNQVEAKNNKNTTKK
jgi:hypothetical protein